MATRRSTIEIEVLGIAALAQLNRDLATHDRRLQALTATYINFNAAVAAANPQMQRLGNTFVTVNNTTNNVNRSINTTTNNILNMGQAANRAGGQFGGLLGTMLQYRAVGLVFSTVTKAVGDTFEAMKELEKQSARVQRLSSPGSTPLIRSTIAEEVARTGSDIKDVGEAYYQITPFIKEANAQFAALQATMNLVVGTESDARDTARALIQVYNQFGNQLDQTASKQENLRRIGELFAISFKSTNTEVGEISQSLKYFGSIAAAAKIPIEQVFALVGALDKAGIRSSSAGTALRASVGNIISKYNPNLPDGGSGVMFKGRPYHFDAPLTPQGGLDPVKMFKSIADQIDRIRHDGLPNAEYRALQFWKAVSGRENSTTVTAVMTTIKDLLRDMTSNMEEYKTALRGGTTEAEKLKNTMLTTATEFDRVWKGTISTLGALIDASPLRGWLHGIAGDITAAAAALRLLQGSHGAAETSDRALFSSTGTASIHRTRSTVNAALANARNDYQGQRWFNTPNVMFGKDDMPGFLTTGMTDEQKAMLRRRYFNNGAPQNWHDIVMSMQRDSRIMDDQLRNPFVGPLAPAAVSGGLQIRSISKNANLPPVGPGKEDEKAANEAEKAAQRALDSEARRLQTEFENTKNRFGEFDTRTLQAGKLADAAAARAGDEDQRLRLKYRLTGNVSELTKAGEKRTEEQIEKAKDYYKQLRTDMAQSARTDYDIAAQKHGVLSGPVSAAAAAAQRAAEAEAIADGKPDTLRRLRSGLEGPQFEHDKRRQEAAQSWAETFASQYGISAPSISGIQNQFGEGVATSAERRLSALQRGGRGNDIFTNQTAAEGGRLQSSADIAQSVVDTLAKMPAPTQQIIDLLAQWKEKLLNANAALVDFNDKVTAESYQKRVQTQADEFQARNESINHLHRLKFYKDEDAAQADGVRKYQELLASAQKNLDDLSKNEFTADGPKQLAEAAKEVKDASRNLTDFQTESNLQKYQNVYGNTKSTVHGALMDFFHGQGDAGTVIERVGGSIVDAALESQIKAFSDPLIQTVTSQILEIQNNTDALRAATDAINGGGGGGAGGGGGSGSGGGGSASRRRGPSDLQKGIGAGLAAYSIGAQSASQGVNAGNLIGSALTGFALGGPIGAGVGIAADLIGGLFHKKSTPTATPQDLNPALYNAPSALNLAAYNYSAYGKLPTMQNVGFDVRPTNVPIVIVNIDGARVAAKQEISRQASSVNVSLLNTTRNRYQPL